MSAAEKAALVRRGLEAKPWGAMMGSEFCPIVAAELHDRNAIDDLLPERSGPISGRRSRCCRNSDRREHPLRHRRRARFSSSSFLDTPAAPR